MNVIITVGREFGSGGRELGKRLADELGILCYDKEILSEVAKLQGVALEHIERISETDIRQIYPTTIGKTLVAPVYYNDNAIQTLVAQQEVIKRLAAQGDCVFVGRSADVILRDLHPMNLFVYADKQTKVRRCLERVQEGESEKSILKQMQKVDRERAPSRRIMLDSGWGKKETYHLCINTSGTEIKEIVSALAVYVKNWFALTQGKK